jgi:hypothetical protein
MDARYRSNYAGEFVILETRWAGGKKDETREWIANPIENQHISGRAACIGTDFDRVKFEYARLQRHRGGLLGSKKLQTYGTGSITLEMRLDFAVETNSELLDKIIESGYQENNIVYTSPRQCIAHPGEFYLIPQTPKLLDIATIVYLAAFDQHQEIFLLGYNKEVDVGNSSWYKQVLEVITAYPEVTFYFVGEKTNMFDEWLDANNTKTFNYLDFISYCDV